MSACVIFATCSCLGLVGGHREIGTEAPGAVLGAAARVGGIPQASPVLLGSGNQVGPSLPEHLWRLVVFPT